MKYKVKSGGFVEAVMYTGLLSSLTEVSKFTGNTSGVNRAGFMRVASGGFIALPELPDGTRVYPGDWVVKSEDGMFSVSKPNDFASQHEEIK